jgi:mannosyltransferase
VELSALMLRRRGQEARRRAGALDGALVAVFAVAVSAAGAARPSLWFDEAATISASTRTLPQLWGLLGNIDAVHGAYYLLMHGWFAVFPATEFWSRFSSCLAVGLAAAGVVALARRFVGRSSAVTAGIVFAIMPRITWAGIEARSYALTAAVAVWLTVLLVESTRRRRRGLWACYGVGMALATVLNVFMVLLVLVHAAYVVNLHARRSAPAWAVAAGAAIVAVAPFLFFCRTQIAQVHWISPLSAGTVGEILGKQYFDQSVAFAVCAALILLLPLLFRRLRPTEPGARDLIRLAVAWMVLPTAVMLVYSAVAEPIYYPRYLTYTSPAMALLLGVCIVAIVRSRERATAVVAVLAVAATPNFLFGQRGPYAKEGMDFSQVADVVTAHAAPGDCLIMDNTTTWLPGPIRPLTAARPAAYAPLVDPGRGMRAADRNRLWDAHLGIWGVADQIRRCTVLWTVSQRDPSVPDRESGAALDPGPRLRRAPAYQVPERMGFHVVERWQFNFAQIVKSTR